MYLMGRGENWELYDTRRILYWPLVCLQHPKHTRRCISSLSHTQSYHHAYCFKKMTDEQVRERDVKGSPATQTDQANAALSHSAGAIRLTSYDPNEDGETPHSTRRPLRSYPCAATATQAVKAKEEEVTGKPVGESP